MKIKIKDIKHIENSRLRYNLDVSILQQDIKQNGLMQEIGIRRSDNALIYGNRRVLAFKNLGFKEIECKFYDNITDQDLIIMNINENINRQNLGSLEVGRACQILKDMGLKNTEIAVKLSIAKSRVDAALACFRILMRNAPRRVWTLLVYGNRGRQAGISESVVYKLFTCLSRARQLSRQDWIILLEALEEGKLTSQLIPQLRKILLYDNTLNMKKALKILKKCKILYVAFPFNEEKLNEAMVNERYTNPTEYILSIIRRHNDKIIF